MKILKEEKTDLEYGLCIYTKEEAQELADKIMPQTIFVEDTMWGKLEIIRTAYVQEAMCISEKEPFWFVAFEHKRTINGKRIYDETDILTDDETIMLRLLNGDIVLSNGDTALEIK